MTWALRRQLLYIGIFLAVIFLVGFWLFKPYFQNPPTCSDRIQNGDETGVDCGGSCELACSFEVDEVSVLWSRVFEVLPGRYNAVAYLENHNKDAIISKIDYRFRFADENNLYIGQRVGEAFVPHGKKFAIFEPGVGVGNSKPVYTHFEFTEKPIWQRVPKNIIDELVLKVSDIQFTNQDVKPSLSATLTNESLFFLPEVQVVAILYDANGNAVATSQTSTERMYGEEKRELNFTWPAPIDVEIVAKEIIPIFDVTSAQVLLP